MAVSGIAKGDVWIKPDRDQQSSKQSLVDDGEEVNIYKNLAVYKFVHKT